METNKTALSPPSEAPTNRRLWWTVPVLGVVITGMVGSRLIAYFPLSQTTNESQDDPRQTPKPAKALLSNLLVGLLVFSAILALADACRARWSVNVNIDNEQQAKTATITRQTSMGGLQKRPPLTRRCSLVDLTMSRHERREVAHHHHQPISLPETSEPPFTGTFRSGRRRPPPLSRHCSFSIRGSEFADVIPGSGSAAAVAVALQRSSMELSDGEMSPDTRRRCSRLIRRH